MDKKTRSPRHPQINLQEALEKTRLIYEKEHIHRADREVIARDLGYTGINGASASVIASLRQFGLLELIGDSMRVTDEATTILELPLGDPARVDAIKRVAFTPKLFAELNAQFGSRLPSDESLRLYLVKAGFNSNAANYAIRAYRETLSVVKNETQGYDGDSDTSDVSQDVSQPLLYKSSGVPDFETRRPFSRTINDLQTRGIPVPQHGNFSEDLHYRLAEDCRVRLLFEGNVTKEAIRKLIAYLELGMDDFRSKSHQEQLQIIGQPEPIMLTEGETDK